LCASDALHHAAIVLDRRGTARVENVREIVHVTGGFEVGKVQPKSQSAAYSKPQNGQRRSPTESRHQWSPNMGYAKLSGFVLCRTRKALPVRAGSDLGNA